MCSPLSGYTGYTDECFLPSKKAIEEIIELNPDQSKFLKMISKKCIIPEMTLLGDGYSFDKNGNQTNNENKGNFKSKIIYCFDDVTEEKELFNHVTCHGPVSQYETVKKEFTLLLTEIK